MKTYIKQLLCKHYWIWVGEPIQDKKTPSLARCIKCKKEKYEVYDSKFGLNKGDLLGQNNAH